MDNPTYVALNRQSGLMGEMRAIANNIANLSTTGFRKEGVVFAEHVADLEGHEPSLSMASAEGRVVNLSQGTLAATGGTFDLAIEGEGFFAIETPQGTELTRAGAFTLSAAGELVTAEGYRVLDRGEAPIVLDPAGGAVAVSGDGTISVGPAIAAQVGVFRPADPAALRHVGGTRFATQGVEPLEVPSVFQGFLENSNVNPIEEIARMIEVQRAYEMGQGFLEKEDARVRAVIDTVMR